MIGRLIIGIAVLALIAGIATGGVGLYSRQHRPHYTFWNAEGAEVDTAANADSVFLTAYSTQYTGADTAGHPNRLTYAKSDSGGGGWYITNPTWNIYLVVRDSFGTIDTLADDFLIVGRVLGDSTISDTLVFKANVVPGSAIVSMSGTKLDSGTVAQSKIGAGAIDSTRLASNAVHPPHIDTAWDFAFREVSTDTLSAKDSTHIRVIENLLCDSTLTIGAFTIGIVDGANGQVLKTNGSGTLSWQPDNTGAGGADYADSLRLGGTTYDADRWFTTAQIDTANTHDAQWQAYIQARQISAYLLLTSFPDSIAVTASTELSDTADLLYESELDAFSELQTQIGDKTLVNEEDVCTIDADWVNTANPWAVNEVHGDLLTATEGNAAYLALAAFADSIAVTASTELTDTAEILYETELNTFAELQTQIADKVLVNTADAANMVLATVTGTVDMGGATSAEMPNAANPTTDAEGEYAWDSNDDALEVYSGDEVESVLIPIYQKIDVLIFAPDGVNDQLPILHVKALLYPHGIELDSLSITLPADAAYSMVFEEWTMVAPGDPPTYQNDIETVTTGATDAYKGDDGTINDAVIDAGDFIFLDIPATDVDWIHVQVIYHVTEGN